MYKAGEEFTITATIEGVKTYEGEKIGVLTVLGDFMAMEGP